MFVLALLADTIRIPPHLLAKPTALSVQSEIERRYPNKIIMDVGLVICPYGPAIEIGDGILVPGDGGAHHQVIFQVVLFKPFVDEILVGIVTESKEEGVMVSVGGFFENVFIPAYWMLNPSTFDEASGLWVWTPNYDDEEDEDEEEGDRIGNGVIKQEGELEAGGGDDDVEQNRFEIEIGAEIRFKVKAVNFTRITTTMKGVQATTTTSHSTATSSEHSPLELTGYNGNSAKSTSQSGNNNNNVLVGNGGEGENETRNGTIRNRSSSADLCNSAHHPAPMQILGSICEDGLGLTIWWRDAAEGEEDDVDDE
jgi:DNA-directed RNA polymerase III subunit RPC8